MLSVTVSEVPIADSDLFYTALVTNSKNRLVKIVDLLYIRSIGNFGFHTREQLVYAHTYPISIPKDNCYWPTDYGLRY